MNLVFRTGVYIIGLGCLGARTISTTTAVATVEEAAEALFSVATAMTHAVFPYAL